MKWFRFYSDALDDPKVQRLPGDLFKTWVNLLCLANKSDQRGVLPSPEDCAFALRMDFDAYCTHMNQLLERGLIDAYDDHLSPHNWEGRQKASDNVTARVQQFRNKDKESETLPKRFGNALDKTKKEIEIKKETKKETETEKETKKETPTPIRPPVRDVTPPDGGENAGKPSPLSVTHVTRFDAFWQAYPKKVGKKSCVDWWEKHKPDADLTQTILDAIQAHIRGDLWQRGFIKDPIRWLKEERWNDEVAPPPREHELVGKDRERMEVARRVLARREHERSGIDGAGYETSGALSRVFDGH